MAYLFVPNQTYVGTRQKVITASSSNTYAHKGTQRWLAFRDISLFDREEVRLPGEYLLDAGYFDTFDNNQVHNMQFKGTIQPLGPNSSKISLIEPSDGTYLWHVRRYPAVLQVGNTSYNVIGPNSRFDFGYAHRWSYHDIVSYQRRFVVGRPGAFVLCHADVHFYARKKGTSPSSGPGNLQDCSVSWTKGPSGVSIYDYFDHSHVREILWNWWLGREYLSARPNNSFADLKEADFMETYGFAMRILDILVSAAQNAWAQNAPSQGSYTTTITVPELSYPDDNGRDWLVEADREMPYHAIGKAQFTPKELSIHAREVVEAYNAFDSNMLAYAADIKKTGDTVRTLLKLGKNWKNPKAWAEAWLSGRYGDRLMISDTRELLESLGTELTTRMKYVLARRRLSGTTVVDGVQVSMSRTSTLVAENESYNDLMTGINNLMRWDVWPTLENVWDMIPLSFVVDWFIPVQDLLGQIDTAVQAPYIKPVTSYIGQRNEMQVSYQSDRVVCRGSLVLYYRRYYSILSDIRPFDVSAELPSFSVEHTLDAVALVATLRGHR